MYTKSGLLLFTFGTLCVCACICVGGVNIDLVTSGMSVTQVAGSWNLSENRIFIPGSLNYSSWTDGMIQKDNNNNKINKKNTQLYKMITKCSHHLVIKVRGKNTNWSKFCDQNNKDKDTCLNN